MLIVAVQRQSGIIWLFGGVPVLLGPGLASNGTAPSVAFDVHLEDGGVVDEAVDSRDGHCRIGEDLSPISERLVCRDQQRAAFVSRSNEFEQHTGLAWSLLT